MALGKDGIDPEVMIHRRSHVVPGSPIAAPPPPKLPSNATVNVPVDVPLTAPMTLPLRVGTVVTHAELNSPCSTRPLGAAREAAAPTGGGVTR